MKRQIKKLLLRSRLLRAVANVNPRKAVILRYHSIQPDPARFSNTIGEGISHSEVLFAEQMEMVCRRFNPVTIDDIVRWLQGGAPLPKRAVAITFDDGFADNYHVASPVLARYGLQAAFYLAVRLIGTNRYPWFCRLRRAFYCTSLLYWTEPGTGEEHALSDSAGRWHGFLSACRTCAVIPEDRREEFLECVEHNLQVPELLDGSLMMMDWEQVVALQRLGHIIGSHTMSHPNLAHSAEEDIVHELQESKRILEQRLATRIVHFSYPSPILEPHYSDVTTAFLAKYGYISAVTCIPGPVRRQDTPLLLSRVFAPLDKDEFLWSLETSLAGYIL
jgi:peptidoglycan/xylan/chitin deacetylase (PgdA/CDA1 family)